MEKKYNKKYYSDTRLGRIVKHIDNHLMNQNKKNCPIVNYIT